MTMVIEGLWEVMSYFVCLVIGMIIGALGMRADLKREREEEEREKLK